MPTWIHRLWRIALVLALIGASAIFSIFQVQLEQTPAAVALTIDQSARPTILPSDQSSVLPKATSTVTRRPPRISGWSRVRAAESLPSLADPERTSQPTEPDSATSETGLADPPAPTSPAEVVEMTIGDVPGTWGIAFRNLDTGETYLLNEDQYFPSASLYKLLLMYAVFRDRVPMDEVLVPQERHFVEAGVDEPLSAGMALTVSEALDQMITVSSNAAAYVLAERVGWHRVNGVAEELGLARTTLPVSRALAGPDSWRTEMTSTSPADMLVFFTELYNHKLVDEAASARMIELLQHQQIGDRFPALLPRDVAVAHKTGNLGGIVNDAGIIEGPDGRFVLVALAQDTDERAASEAQALLALRLYDLVASGTTPADE